MNATRIAQAEIGWFAERREPTIIRLDLSNEGLPRPQVAIGRGLDPVALDLVDCAAMVFHIDRSLTGRMRTTRPVKFALRLPVRVRKRWTAGALKSLSTCLSILGYADWQIEPVDRTKVQEPRWSDDVFKSSYKRVALFSGGMDSACGVGELAPKELAVTKLVSFYTRQKSRQIEIAEVLDAVPLQWTFRPRQARRRGSAYWYRSFLYLAMAAASARALNVREILQCENGVLAYALPFTGTYRMTRHAHPLMLQAFSEFASQLFDERMTVDNPLLCRTKLEAVQALQKRHPDKWKDVLNLTETCWAHNSPRSVGGTKVSGRPCGACVPCLVRATAYPFSNGEAQWNLLQDKSRSNVRIGADFRSICSFAYSVRSKGKQKTAEFYRMFDEANRRLVGVQGYQLLEDLHALYRRFADEFCDTFKL